MINKTAALVLFVLLSSHFAWGQTFFTEQLSTKNGLSSNHVTCITQDKFGTLWIGTANGLNRYDGYRVKVYHHNPWDSLTLPFHQVDFLFADSKGGIWALSGNTVAYLTAGEVHFKVLQLTTNEVAYAVNEDNKNNIYIGSNQAFYILEDGKKLNRLINQPVYSIQKNTDHFTLSSRSNIYKFDFSKKEITGNYADQFALLGGKVYNPSATQLINNHLFIYNGYSGLIDANLQTEKYTNFNVKNELHNNFSKIPAFWIDSNMTAWVGTTKGLYTFTLTDTSIQQVTEKNTGPQAIQYQYITALTGDQRNNLWIGTRQNGVYCYAYLNQHFRSVSTNTLPAGNATAILPLNNTVFFGTEWQGLFEYNNSQKTAKAIPQNEFFSVHALTAQHNGSNMWVGTEKGLYNFSPDKKTFTLHKLYTDTLDQTITAVCTERDGSLWLGSNIGLLHYFPATKDVFIYFHEAKKNTISSNTVKRLYMDTKNRLWVGTDRGLDLFNTEKNSAERFGQALNAEKVNVNCISEDTKGNLWIGVQQGALFKLNPITHKSENIILNKALNASSIQSVWAGNEQYIWFTTANNLMRHTLSSGKIDIWRPENGLPVAEFSQNCLTPNLMGELIAGHHDGLLLFNPKLPVYDLKLLPVISEVTVNGQLMSFTNGVVNINNGVKQLMILLGDADLNKGAAFQFEYRLNGLDNNWHVVQNNLIAFSELSEGNYELEIRAKGFNEDSYSDIKRLRIEIVPPIWKTFTFLLFCCIVTAGILWWLIARAVSKFKAQEAAKHELERHRLDLELRAYKAQLDSQFISNTLYQVQECINSNKLLNASQYLSKFSSYISCVLEYGEKDFITVEQLIKTLDYYMSIERLRFNGELDFKINCSPKINALNTFIPNMLVQPYVENAIWQGLKQKVKERRIEINFEPWSKNHVLCTIEDNGIGRKMAAQLRASKIDLHGSEHTLLAEERIQMLQDSLSNETRLEILDLVNDAGDATGTKVILHLPTA